MFIIIYIYIFYYKRIVVHARVIVRCLSRIRCEMVVLKMNKYCNACADDTHVRFTRHSRFLSGPYRRTHRNALVTGI